MWGEQGPEKGVDKETRHEKITPLSLEAFYYNTLERLDRISKLLSYGENTPIVGQTSRPRSARPRWMATVCPARAAGGQGRPPYRFPIDPQGRPRRRPAYPHQRDSPEALAIIQERLPAR